MTAALEQDGIDLRENSDEAFARRLKARTMLMAEFEHKVKTSLTVMLGWTSTLEERWDGLTEDDRRAGIGAIGRTARELLTQVEGLLEESQVELGALDLSPVTLDLAAVMRLSTDTYRGSTALHEIVYRGPESFEAHVDPAALQQVLGYLMENAVKYSPGGGTIMLSLEEMGGDVVVSVVDEGIGVPDDIDVFAPFQRGRNGQAVRGAGLGLYIVRNLVVAMGGKVEAALNSPARGSTFVVRFPVSPGGQSLEGT